MVRSALAVLALLLVPALASAQQPQEARTHTVTQGNTLWGLARTYYGDPYQWHRIFEANRDQIQDPDVLEPGLVLHIPGEATGAVRSVSVAGPSPEGEPVAAAGRARPLEEAVPRAGPGVSVDEMDGGPPQEAPRRRTVMYPEPVVRGAPVPERTPRLAFSEDDFFRAQWLVPLETEPDHVATLAGLAAMDVLRRTVLPFDEVRLTVEGAVPGVGSRLQTFRVGKALEGVGLVVMPTGTLTVTGVDGDGAIAVVDKVYARMEPGDLVRPLPRFPITREMEARPVDSDLRASIIGFPDPHQIEGVGDYVFLGAGSSQDVRPGDVFDIVWDDAAPEEQPGGGSVQVLTVHQGYATGRILRLENPVFETGVVLRLSQRMQ